MRRRRITKISFDFMATRPYAMHMMDWARMVVIVLVAALAAASVVQIAQAAETDIQRSLPSDVDGGCTDCADGPDDVGMTCCSECATASPALPAGHCDAVKPSSAAHMEAAPLSELADWRAPPEPFPPKRVS